MYLFALIKKKNKQLPAPQKKKIRETKKRGAQKWRNNRKYLYNQQQIKSFRIFLGNNRCNNTGLYMSVCLQ